MTDKIAYLSVDHGMDGMGQESIVRAVWTRKERDALANADKNKAYQRSVERIVEMENAHKDALKKLNALDKLVLGLDANGDPIKTKIQRHGSSG